jgi:hypothetical protein
VSQTILMQSTRIAAAIAVLMLAACSKPLTTEQLIIGKIRNIEAQIEEGERRRFLNNIAEDFRGQNGRMNRQQLHAFVVLQLTRYEELNARLFPISVQTISDTEATAVFKALVTGGSGLIPEDGQLYEFTTHWRKDDEEWFVIAANWAPAPMGELLD